MIITEETRANIVKIANTYGIDAQTDIAIEEMAELTKALLKYRRTNYSPAAATEIAINIVEELADVQIMILQLEYLLRYLGWTTEGEWHKFIKEKIARQLERIAAETAAAEIKVICPISENCDEKDAGGLWDLSAEIAFNVAISRGEKPATIDVEEWGQETIYKLLRDLAKTTQITIPKGAAQK